MNHFFKQTSTKFFLIVVIAGLLSIDAQAQLKVGNNPTTLNANAILEIESANKGLLLPRVALSATNNPSPLTAHAPGMVVYNTATASSGATAVSPGFYTNDGTKWDRMITSIGFVPTVVASASLGSGYTVNDNSGINKCRLSSVNLNDGGFNNTTFEYTVGSSGTYNLAITLGYLLNNNSGFNRYDVFAIHANSAGVTLKLVRLNFAANLNYTGAQSSAIFLAGSAVFRASVGDKLYFATQPCSGCAGSYTNVDIEGVFQKLSN